MINQGTTFPVLPDEAGGGYAARWEADVRPVAAGTCNGVDIDGAFHSQAPLYMNSEHGETEEVRMRLRTAHGNVKAVEVILKDYVAPPKSAGQKPDGEHESTGTAEQEAPPVPSAPETEIAMEKRPQAASGGRYDWWEAVLPPSTITRQYVFRLAATNGGIAYYAVEGLQAEKRTEVNDWFRIAPGGTSTPEWAKNTVYYSMMVDSFFNGDTENDPTQKKGTASTVLWGTDRRIGSEWYGGDLEGVKEKLSYIQETLGADTIYTNPTFEATHNAGYGQFDYTTINAYYGTNKEYADMIRAAHERGMRVLNDGVWLYIVWHQHRYTNLDGKYPAIGAFQAEDSEFHDFVDWEEWGKKWRALYYDYPSVNFDSAFTRDIMIHNPDSALQYFLREPYNMDGWRLDVPSFGGNVYTEDEIIAMMKKDMRAISRDKILIGEYGSDAAMAAGDYDTIWYHGDVPASLRAYLGEQNATGLWSPYGDKDKPRDETSLLEFFRRKTNYLPWQNGAVAYTLLSTHDTIRIADSLDNDQSKLERAIAMQMTVMGSPCIYHGDEIGMSTGYKECVGYYRMNGFDWDTSHWNWDTFHTYKSLIALRHTYDAVYRAGVYQGLLADNDRHVLAYGRYIAGKGAVTLINSDTADHVLAVPMYEMDVTDGTVVYDWENGYRYTVTDGTVNAKVFAGRYAVLVYGGAEPNGGYTGQHWECAPVGHPAQRGYAVPDDANHALLHITGFGTLDGERDTMQYVGRGAVGDVAVTVRLSALSALKKADAAGLMLRHSLEGDAACFLVLANETGVTVRWRAADGKPMDTGKTHAGADALWLRLERRGAMCTASVAPDENGKAGTWSVLDTAAVDLRAALHAGVAIAGEHGATVTAQELNVTPQPTVWADDFRQPVLSGIWGTVPQSGAYQLTGQGLTLEVCRETVALRTAPRTDDWSVRTEVLPAAMRNGDEAGLVSWTTAKQQARLKRVQRDGRSWLVLETEAAGLVREQACEPDTAPQASVTLQLQKIGGYLSALVREQGKDWRYLGVPVWYNVAESRNGVYAHTDGLLRAAFGFFEYGAALAGVPGSVDMPVRYTGPAPLALANKTADEQYRYGAGQWDYADAGYMQHDAGGEADMRVNKTYAGNYRLDVCVELRGNGAAGVAFGVPDEADGHRQGCKVLLGADNRVALYENGTVLLRTAPAWLDTRREVRLTVYVTGNRVQVYGDNRPVLEYTGVTATKGAVRYLTEEAQATFRNLSASEYGTAGLYTLHGGNFRNVENGIQSDESALAMAALPYAVGDFTLRTTLTLLPPAEGAEPKTPGGAGIAFFGQLGQNPLQNGECLYVQEGKLSWMEDGITRTQVALEHVKDAVPLALEIRVSKGRLTVTADGRMVLEDTLKTAFSGGLTFLSNARQARFDHITIDD